MATAKPPTRGEQTRSTLIEAAHELFLDNGFHGTSMRQIARKAKLTLSGIYNHFDSKEAIWIAVLLANHPYHDLLPALAEAQGTTAEDFFRDAAQRMLVGLSKHPRMLNLMLIELVEFEGRHIPSLMETMIPQFIAAFSKAQQYHAELRPLSPLVMMRAFLGLFFSHYIIDMLLQQADTSAFLAPGKAPDWFAGAVDIYLRGVLAPED
jgi:TetR/AcrR family transcriptional repressor of mexJK operon